MECKRFVWGTPLPVFLAPSGYSLVRDSFFICFCGDATVAKTVSAAATPTGRGFSRCITTRPGPQLCGRGGRFGSRGGHFGPKPLLLFRFTYGWCITSIVDEHQTRWITRSS